VHNITHIKNPDSYLHEKVHQRFQEKLNRSSAITYISEYAKSSTHQFFKVPAVPEYVIYNGNPMTDTSVSKGFTPGFTPPRNYLFSIGQITGRKNFISLVRMLVHTPEFDLVVAGKNATEAADEIKAEAKKLGIQNRVHLIGNISGEEKRYFFTHCEAFVFPSLREGFGLPVIEAMLFGKPVFTSNNTSLPEVGGEEANYWDHFEPKYMADVLTSGLEHFKNNESEIVPKLKARAKQFSWETAAKQYTAVYKSLLK